MVHVNDFSEAIHAISEAEVAALRALSYVEYLRSSYWEYVRRWMAAYAGYRCQLCASAAVLHVHHNNYECLGRETRRDLCVLCGSCHKRHHKVATKRRRRRRKKARRK